jgi:hypothetical protein
LSCFCWQACRTSAGAAQHGGAADAPEKDAGEANSNEDAHVVPDAGQAAGRALPAVVE